MRKQIQPNEHSGQKNKAQSASFTGHRNIAKTQIETVKNELKQTVISLANKGITKFFNGGAVGFDMLAAETVIALKTFSGLPVRLIMVLPSREHEAKWTADEKNRLHDILSNADEIIYLSERYYDGCMAVRNKYLVENSGVCVAYMKHKRSGTSQTVRMAKENGLTIINLAENKKGGTGFMQNFEMMFSEFIDGNEYDKAEEAFVELLFTTVRSSFKAGWTAAGGEAPQTSEVAQYLRPSRTIKTNDG